MKMAATANETGGMILIHLHDNKAVLDLLKEANGQLYYNDKPVMTPISKQDHNAIKELTDGLHVDNTYFLNKTQFDVLTGFTFVNGTLYHNNKIVSQEYTDLQMQLAVAEVWKAVEQTEGFDWVKRDEAEEVEGNTDDA